MSIKDNAKLLSVLLLSLGLMACGGTEDEDGGEDPEPTCEETNTCEAENTNWDNSNWDELDWQ